MTHFHRDVLRLDPEREAERIVGQLRHNILEMLKRNGGVLGVSGGVDSAVALALAVRALGPERLVALLLPEMESSRESARLGREVCRQFGVTPIVEDVTGPLLGFDCYRRRDEAVRAVFFHGAGRALLLGSGSRRSGRREQPHAARVPPLADGRQQRGQQAPPPGEARGGGDPGTGGRRRLQPLCQQAAARRARQSEDCPDRRRARQIGNNDRGGHRRATEANAFNPDASLAVRTANAHGWRQLRPEVTPRRFSASREGPSCGRLTL